MEGNVLLTWEESVYHIPPDQLRRTSQQDKVFVTITARAPMTEEEREAFIPLRRFRPKMRILFRKGWLAIAKLKPLSLFISLFQHCQMLS